MKKALVLLVILGALGGAWYYYRLQVSRAEGIPEYTTTTVARGEVVQSVTATGSLDAVLSVDVGSQISGLITKLYADFNTRVKEGQKLAELDPSSYEQSVRQADADVASADASSTLAELNAKRTHDLFTKSLVTQQDDDQAQAQLKQARAALLTKQAALENAKVNLARCTVYSPIDGIVISKQTEVGKTVAAGLNVPVLFTIANDLAKMQITAAVAEADIGSVVEGQKATFTVDAFPNRNFSGEITQVRNAPQNTNNVITYNTIISVDNRDLKLRPGMTANVSIIVAHRDKTLRVPNAALRVRMPEGLAVTRTNEAGKSAAAPSAASAATSTATASGGGGNGGGFRRMFGPDAPPEVRQKMRDIMAEIGFTPGSGPPSPEQREQMRKLMIERGLITAEEAAAASARRSSGDQPVYITRTVYRLPGGDKNATPEAVSVKVGITDGLGSEIADGLAEGDVLITSANIPSARRSAQPANPLSGQPPRRF
jgi:HlyD family secretion protein